MVRIEDLERMQSWRKLPDAESTNDDQSKVKDPLDKAGRDNRESDVNSLFNELKTLVAELKVRGIQVTREGNLSWNMELHEDIDDKDMESLEDKLTSLISQLPKEKLNEIFSPEE